jgi:hypothetical protein
MTSRLIFGIGLVVLLLGNASAREPLKSGPQVTTENDRRGFRPQFVAGPSAGQNLCPV